MQAKQPLYRREQPGVSAHTFGANVRPRRSLDDAPATSHRQGGAEGGVAGWRVALEAALEAAARNLPAQGPISIFIHHNTLHAFEELPFERAVVEGGQLLGCEPFLGANVYREAVANGRITRPALRSTVVAELSEGEGIEFPGGQSAAEVLELLLVHGIPPAGGRQLRWMIEEGDAGRALRPDLPDRIRRRILERSPQGKRGERLTATALWRSAMAAAERQHRPPSSTPHPPLRLRDLILQRSGVDSDELVHPLLIRLSAAYLDQGIAHWAMPGQEAGFHATVMELYGRDRALFPEEWLRRFAALLAEDRIARRDEWSSVRDSLEAFGVAADEWGRFLEESALPLRGWAGMFRQLESRPDRVPVYELPARLAGFMAIRLLAERASLAHLAQEQLGWRGSLATLRGRLTAGWMPPVVSTAERAWQLFQLWQLLGMEPKEADQLSPRELGQLDAFLARYDETNQRRLLHLAYEQSFYDQALGALQAHKPVELVGPDIQVVCCLDEREESFRRHIEEVAPNVETLSYPGFFGIPMAFRGIDDAHSRPLCPVVIVPKHEVGEFALGAVPRHIWWRRRLHRLYSRQKQKAFGRGTTLATGTLSAGFTGVLSAVPLVLRVLLPHRDARLRKRTRALLRPRPTTALAIERSSDAQPDAHGRFHGFTTDEMAEIVGNVLREMGVSGRLAPLVVMLAHGSTSLNNPHESAHDCGACGGGHGGPNARAFAAMANNPNVREALSARGDPIPAETWFVGGEHNTCDDSVTLFDTNGAPEQIAPPLAQLDAVLDQARARNAHERSRRYDSFAMRRSEALALQHVELRANDLAQPRPEYGHATNALCVIGPRSKTRGLFLDRRAFLTSYDASTDPDGTLLAQLAAAVVPVVAGISLEYYFSVVDPTGYGCGTKLPHNVSALLGVMDGHASDLRTGLPWQMVEIHEPMRLLILVDASPSAVESVVAGNTDIARLVENGWVRLFARDPGTNRLWAWAGAGFVPLRDPAVSLDSAASSRAWYEGKREHLAFASITGRP